MFGIFTTIASGISTLFSCVGAAVCNFASKLIMTLPKVVEVAKVVLQGIGDVIVKVAQALSISPANENIQELGAKAMQEDTRPIMEDESMEDYMNYLREEVELDKDKMLKMTEEEKIQCQAVGASMLTKAITEKTGIEISPEFLIAMNNMRMSEEAFLAYLKTFGNSGIESMDSLTKYLTGSLSDKDMLKMHDIVIDTEKSLNPGSTTLEIQSKIDEYKDAVEVKSENQSV